LVSTRAEAKISISYPTKPDADALRQGLEPEMTSSKDSRAFVRIKTQGKVVTMRFTAGDPVALRAMLNSFLRLAGTWRKLCENLQLSNGDQHRSGSMNLLEKR